MITRTLKTLQRKNWQKSLAEAITDPKELLALLQLSAEQFRLQDLSSGHFPLRVPHAFISRMKLGDPNDPLLLQVLPVSQEQIKTPGFSADPLHEKQSNPLPGVLRKYQGRVLLTATAACGIHCRYCFRQYFPYADNQLGRSRWDDMLAYIQNDLSIHEVILSGGDPLTLGDDRLEELCGRLAQISHIKRLRFHTRMPVILPDRVCDALLNWLKALPIPIVMVLHINHANEINSEVVDALAQLKKVGVHLLNQAVLLEGINGTVDAQIQLSEALFAAGVLPYYLHLLDKVTGTAHFDVDESNAKKIIWEMMQQLPGYLVPKLVREMPGQPSKMPISIL